MRHADDGWRYRIEASERRTTKPSPFQEMPVGPDHRNSAPSRCLKKGRRCGRPCASSMAQALSKLIEVFFGQGRRALPPPRWLAAVLQAEGPDARKPPEAEPAAEPLQAERPDGAAVSRRRQVVDERVAAPQVAAGSLVVVQRRPVGGSPVAASQWRSVGLQAVEPPAAVARCFDSWRVERGRPAFAPSRAALSSSMADCAHAHRPAARRGPCAAPQVSARSCAVAR
jgi:hypothetical protein